MCCVYVQVGVGVAAPRVFEVGGMSQLADYVYRDYHTRMVALNSRVQYSEVKGKGLPRQGFL